MHVQTFVAAHDAAVALHGMHIGQTGGAMLATTAARPCAAEIAVFLAHGPRVRVLDLVVYTQKRLLLVLIGNSGRGAGLAPNAPTCGASGEAILVCLRLHFAAATTGTRHLWRAHGLGQELVLAVGEGSGQP